MAHLCLVLEKRVDYNGTITRPCARARGLSLSRAGSLYLAHGLSPSLTREHELSLSLSLSLARERVSLARAYLSLARMLSLPLSLTLAPEVTLCR